MASGTLALQVLKHKARCLPLSLNNMVCTLPFEAILQATTPRHIVKACLARLFTQKAIARLVIALFYYCSTVNLIHARNAEANLAFAKHPTAAFSLAFLSAWYCEFCFHTVTISCNIILHVWL